MDEHVRPSRLERGLLVFAAVVFFVGLGLAGGAIYDRFTRHPASCQVERRVSDALVAIILDAKTDHPRHPNGYYQQHIALAKRIAEGCP